MAIFVCFVSCVLFCLFIVFKFFTFLFVFSYFHFAVSANFLQSRVFIFIVLFPSLSYHYLLLKVNQFKKQKKNLFIICSNSAATSCDHEHRELDPICISVIPQKKDSMYLHRSACHRKCDRYVVPSGKLHVPIAGNCSWRS